MTTSSRNIDLKWVEEQVSAYKKIFPRYKKYAETLEAFLKGMARKLAFDAIVQSRPKSISSFAEKVVRKNHKYQDPLNQLTDLCGARTIVQTQSQVQEICKLIEQYFKIDWGNSIDVKQRLKPSEFGYRSVHYIVELKPDHLPEDEYNIEIPQNLFGLKAEIQVRTILEHAWANLYHVWAYKNEFEIPDKLQREMAGVAARLEAADNSFSGIQENLKTYYTTYGAYLDPDQSLKEIEKLEISLKFEPENKTLLRQLGRMIIALEDWDKAIALLSPFESEDDPVLLRILGTALCKKHKSDPKSPAFIRGQKLLLQAGSPPHQDPDALSSLAGSWKDIDDDKANEYYRKAFELDPTDAYPLGNYLEGEIIKDRDLSVIGFTRPLIKEAIQRSLSCIAVGVNIPWAYYDIGKLELLLKNPYSSFSAYAKAVELSTAPFMMETSLNSLLKLKDIQDQLPGYQWIEGLIWLGLTIKFQKENAKKELLRRVNSRIDHRNQLCTILAGGSSNSAQQEMDSYAPLLAEAFRNYRGIIISGGTVTGISKIAGDLKNAYPENIHAIGYLPHARNAEADEDRQRYDEIRTTEGNDFSPLEATRYWMDLIVSGWRPQSVKLLAINGGNISSAECKLAIMLGAKIGIVEGSGGEPARLLSDPDWNQSDRLIQIPNDASIISTFISSGNSMMNENYREILAKEIHEQYRKTRMKKPEVMEPSLETWENLDVSLKRSNYCQADQIFEKLALIGCGVREVKDREIALMKFSKKEVEMMAELEHARWVVERLSGGWKPAMKKDVLKKLSPYLVGWKYLSEDIKKYDRDTVKNIPAYLAKVGLEVYRLF